MNKIRIAGAAAGVVLVSGIVLQVSSAAFTGTTENAGNSWEAGTVYLSDDDDGLALFSSTSENIVPGYSEARCIEVTYDGTVDPGTAITLAATLTENAGDQVGDDGLADDLDVLVEMGPEGSGCLNDQIVDGANNVLGLLSLDGTTEVHDGDLVTLAGAGALPTWTPAGGQDLVRPFLFSVEMPDDASTPDDAQGDTAVATFTWTATS